MCWCGMHYIHGHRWVCTPRIGISRPAFGCGQCGEAWEFPACSAVCTSACAPPPMAVHGAAAAAAELDGPGLGGSQAVSCKACIPPPDVRALPTCRWLYNHMPSGTLPKEWSALTSLIYL
jgi:hypothetical protein